MTEHNVNLNTPMMEQYLSIKEKTDAILFFRMGDFYEMFLDDALIASEILEIALTKRNNVPMCGIPYHAKDSYIFKLIKAGKRVAICEQIEDPKKTKKIVKRGIVEILTPGTLVDDKILDGISSNYIICFNIDNKNLSLSFCDVSTGDLFFISEDLINKVSGYEFLKNELFRAKAKEIIFPESFLDDPVLKDLKREHSNALFYPVSDYCFSNEYALTIIKKTFSISSVKGFGITDSSNEVGVIGALIKYITDVQMKDLGYVKNITRLSRKDKMELSQTTIRNLELINNLSDGSQKYTLFNVLNECKTVMGSRLLQEWIKRPLLNTDEIIERHNIVEYFYNDEKLLNVIRNHLKEIFDIERVITRVYFNKAIPREIVSLGLSLSKINEIKAVLLETNKNVCNEVTKLIDKIVDFSSIIKIIFETINDDPPSGFDEGGVIREGFSKELDDLRIIAKQGRNFIVELQKNEVKKTGISSLKIKYNKIIGYFIEISKTNIKNAPAHYIKKQELVGSYRYTLPELEEYENSILGAKDKISIIEQDIFNDLSLKITEHIEAIKQAANSIKIIDILITFSFLALKNNYTKPLINNGDNLLIKEGRHPVVESFFKDEEFIPNDVCMNSKDKRLLLITGPNMSGKSTYLRQTALIIIMAQIGSFIPCEQAEIGIVDKIFTRIGASDSLVKGESTFLVEMIETAEILNNATAKTLTIMDEIGRGTSTYDGLSIAWSIVEYLTDEKIIKGKTLFATHYHELTALAKERGIENFQVLVKEWDDKILFLHKVVPGAASKSYGIQVARLAGVPKVVIDRAFKILNELERNIDGLEAGTLLEERLKSEYSKDQLSLFSGSYDKIINEIGSINVNKMTPIDALTYLNELVDKIRKNKF